jgi:hypothetical protein
MIIIIILLYFFRYGGEQGGTAVADVIFGNYNPGGRLPITFYSSTDQIPPFENYNMTSFYLFIIIIIIIFFKFKFNFLFFL